MTARRPTPKLRALALCLATTLLTLATEVGAAPRCERCNLIVISVDTVRGDHLGCMGHVRDTSPAICRFFAKGIVFENAVSQSPWTGPAHASMFTSLYPHEHGLNDGPMAPTVGEHPDLFSVLKRAGYFTAAIHGGGYVKQALPTKGLDAIVAGKSITFRRDTVGLLHRALADKPEGTPFALFLHGYDPHLDYKPKRNWFTPLEPDLDRIANESRFCRYETLEDGSKRIDPKTVPEDARARSYFEVLYDSEIRDVDVALGRLFAHLERTGLAERTVLIFTSDHGEEFFEHGSCEHVKTVYQELLHVPLMVRIPGAHAVRRRDFVPASIGLAPTALAALGVEAPAGISGWNLLEPRPAPTVFFAETAFRYDRALLRRLAAFRGSRKLVLDPAAGTLELFDLATDPREQRNLAKAQLEGPDLALARELRAYARRSARAEPARGGVELDCETVESLRSLGYLDDSDAAERCP